VAAPTFLTAHDIAALCRVSQSTVSRWSRFGTGGFPKPLVKEAKMHLFLTAEYVRWVDTLALKRGGVPMPVDARTMKRRRHAA